MAPTDIPAWVRLSSPAAGRPFVTSVERVATHVRAAAGQLAEHLTLEPAAFVAVWGPRVGGLGFVAPTTGDEARARAAACLVGEWLATYAIGRHDGAASMRDVHELWTQGSPAAGRVRIPDLAAPFPAAETPDPETVDALLPYLLDPAPPGTRRDVMSGRAQLAARQARKSAGAYFTPGDVAHFVVGAPRADPERRRWLDPAAGSGVLLRAVLRLRPDSQVFGVDLDPVAAELAAFVLMASARAGPTLWHSWQLSRLNLATADALACTPATQPGATAPTAERDAVRRALLAGQPVPAVTAGGVLGRTSRWRLADAFPELADGADMVIQNPPYAPVPAQGSRVLAERWGAGASGNAFTLFLEQGVSLCTPAGALLAIVPASIVTSSVKGVRRCREALHRAGGAVEVISFDRAPDGLFGDDIKTRCSIVIVERDQASSLRVGPLRRITSRNRQSALVRGDGPMIPLSELLSAVPPKLEDDAELELLLAFRTALATTDQYTTRLRSARLEEVSAGPRVMIGSTAYNWLNVQRDSSPALAVGHDSQNPFLVLDCPDRTSADALYALLSSRAALWAWRVFGDGFHVGRRLLSWLPAPPYGDHEAVSRLGKLGADLWQLSILTPVVSANGGRTSVAFPPTRDAQSLLDDLDRLILESVGLSDPPVMLGDWHQRLVIVGRPNKLGESKRGIARDE